MRIRDFEDAVWNLEGIRIVIRGSWSDEVGDYSYERRANQTNTLQELIDNRIRECIGDRDVVAINGRGGVVVGQTTLRTIRNSYR